jgi:molybdopterin-guanine dinucleotide biosynthesis protein A
VIGVVLAGGASRRFGGRAKGLIMLDGRPMALHLVELLSGFCSRVSIEAALDAGYQELGLPLVCAPAEHAGKGPLAGLAAGLRGADAHEQVAFAPCDMPLLTRAIYDTLTQTGGAGSYANTARGVEPLVAILSGGMRAKLLEALAKDALPRTHAVLDAAGANAVMFDDLRPFTNVNTPDDLARLSAR